MEIVGYHVVVVDVTVPVLPPGKLKTALDADLSKGQNTFLVPKQYLEPNRIYEFEVLATEKGGNQTITEGVFSARVRWPLQIASCRSKRAVRNQTIRSPARPSAKSDGLA